MNNKVNAVDIYMRLVRNAAEVIHKVNDSELTEAAFDAAFERVFPLMVDKFMWSVEKSHPRKAATLRKAFADPEFLQAVAATVTR